MRKEWQDLDVEAEKEELDGTGRGRNSTTFGEELRRTGEDMWMKEVLTKRQQFRE